MYCKRCGNEILKNEEVCGNCGTPVEEYARTQMGSNFVRYLDLSKPHNIRPFGIS